jgi:NAD-dependent oxidoreductase involved in siderophore biosynthesis
VSAYEMITNDVNNYINLLVRIVHIICNHPLFVADGESVETKCSKQTQRTLTASKSTFYSQLIDWRTFSSN